MNIATQTFVTMTDEEYHSHPAISRSALMHLRRSPKHYLEWMTNPREEKKDCFTFGKALHCYLLEKHEFDSRYYVLDMKIDRRTKAGKSLYEQSLNEAANRAILTKDQMESIISIRSWIESSDIYMKLISGGVYENSIFWTDPETEIQCKARPDIIHSNMIVDVKTCRSAAVYDFKYDIDRYGYRIQAAMIQDAMKINFDFEMNDFVLLAIEKEPPYAIGVYMLSPAAVQKGRDEYKSLLVKLKECREKNEWPAYEIQEID